MSETRKLIQARDDASIPMGVVHNRQFTHLMTKARKQISNDGIGDIIAIDLVASMRANLSDATRGEWVFNLPGGELGETLPHHVYLALSFVNRLGEIRGVTTHNSMDYDQVDIDGLTLVATDSTGQVNISIKILTNSSLKYELTLYGTNGIMTVDLRNTPGLYLNETSGFSPKTVLKNYAHNIKQLIIESANLIKYKSKERYSRQETAAVEHKSHYKTIQQFISSVEGGKQVPFTLEEGLDTIKVIQALKNRE